jgi:hypothetical protein
MPEPKSALGNAIKVYPVLGQAGLMHEARTRVPAGGSTTGMALFILECDSGSDWVPSNKDGRIETRFWVRHVFGGRSKCSITFQHRTLDEIREFLPEIDGIVKTVENQRERRLTSA